MSAYTRSSHLLLSLTKRSHVVFTGRAATGIWAALRARGIHDQWVLIPANTCYLVVWAVLQSGNRPFLVDVTPSTANISLDTLNQIRLEHIGALIATHMYGLGAPI